MPSLNLVHLGALVAFGSVAFALAPAGCIGGWTDQNIPEGDRCNPYDSHGECAAGLQCTVSSWEAANQSGTTYIGDPALTLNTGAGTNSAGNFNIIPFCPENYCCPVDSNGDLVFSSTGNPNCQPGCNGGAASICTGLGGQVMGTMVLAESGPAPGSNPTVYAGVCDFVATGALPTADAGSGEEAGMDASGEASTDASPEAASTEAGPEEASTDAAPEASSTPTDGGSGG